MRHSPADFVDADDVARAKSRSPHARQLCQGSMAQLMHDDADGPVQCPRCLKKFDVYDTQKNGARVHPIVPSHLPDQAGKTKVEVEEARRGKAGVVPRPY